MIIAQSKSLQPDTPGPLTDGGVRPYVSRLL
jgi:hypothetical protein